MHMSDSDGSHNQDIQRGCEYRECKAEELSQTIEA